MEDNNPNKLFRPWDNQQTNFTNICDSYYLNSNQSFNNYNESCNLPSIYLQPLNLCNIYTPINSFKSNNLFNDSLSSLFAFSNQNYFQNCHLNDDLFKIITNNHLINSYSPSLSSVYDCSTFSSSSSDENVKSLSNSQVWYAKIRKNRPKRFRVKYCQTAFSNNGQLKGHIRTHTGERPFVCEHIDCGKSFTRNEELTRHRRIHSGIRPYSCVICAKRFGRKDHLKKHQRTHEKRLCNINNSNPNQQISHAQHHHHHHHYQQHYSFPLFNSVAYYK